jgi:uncharacterized protein DUF6941
MTDVDVASEPPLFMLCDFAEVLNGKLYVMGGGFDVILADVTAQLALAVIWRVPWDQANRPHELDIQLFSEDCEPVTDADANEIRAKGQMEVGRPAGMTPGQAISAPLAVRIPALSLSPGGYRWELRINTALVASASLRAVQGPSGLGQR